MNNVSGFRKVRIGNVLKEYVTESQMLEALAAYLELEIGNVEQMQVDLHAVEKIPMELAEKYCMLAVAMEGDTLTVLTNDPLNFYGLENVHQVTGMDLQLLLCNGQAVENAIRYYYSEIRARHAAEVANNSQYEGAEELVLEEDEGAQVVNLLDTAHDSLFKKVTNAKHPAYPTKSNKQLRDLCNLCRNRCNLGQTD